MARKWKNEDSARTMVNKYNETAEEVEALKNDSVKINKATQDELDALSTRIDKKYDGISSTPAYDVVAESEEPIFM